MNTIKSIKYRVCARPLRATFATSLGRKDFMKSVLIKVTLADGSRGFGEVPTSHAMPAETPAAIGDLLGEIIPSLRGTDAGEYGQVTARLRKRFGGFAMTLSGLETALFRADLASRGLPEHAYWGGKVLSLETDITIPITANPLGLCKWIEYTATKGFRIFKVKTSGIVEADKESLSRVTGYLDDRVRPYALRLDGNQGYSATSYRAMVRFVKERAFPVECFEQPLPRADFPGLREIRKERAIPVILDESVISLEDLKRVVGDDLCDGINIKVAKSGVSESRRIYEMAKKYGLKVMAGCMIETMVGLSAGICFAAGTGGVDFIDLDAIHFLYHKNRYDRISIDGPRYHIGAETAQGWASRSS
jgi:L-alanine-DL-glutamate epimerase-like enolase superfamily enzyme